MTREMHRAIAIGLAAIVLPLAVAAPAAAKKSKSAKPGPVVTASANSSGTGNQTIVTATAFCPKGTRAVGGGFSSTPPTQGADDVNALLYESRKVGQTAWRASLQIGDTDAPTIVSLNTTAYCRRGAPVTQVASLVTQLPASNGISPRTPVECDRKAKAFGGGFALQPPIVASSAATGWVAESYRDSPRSWVNAAVTSTNGPGVLTSETYCAAISKKKGKKGGKKKGLKLPTPSLATSPATSGVPSSSTTATATCSSRSVVGGGYAQPSAIFPVPPRVAYAYESQRNGSTWRVTALQASDAAVTIDSMALCG